MGPYADALLSLRSVEYINASPIDNLGDGAMRSVATMCPKRETFAYFWSMVWELETRIIVNLTHVNDRVGSGPGDKRERYWPPLENGQQTDRWPVRPTTLAVEACEQVPHLLRYTIELLGPQPADGSERPRRTVALYWYSQWVDFPSSSSIGQRPFYKNAWAVLHIAMHVGVQVLRGGAQPLPVITPHPALSIITPPPPHPALSMPPRTMPDALRPAEHLPPPPRACRTAEPARR
jgi:hypothetical protein